jgi:hypothetical protein
MTALGRTLTEQEWTTESICPGWQTKHALLHRTAGVDGSCGQVDAHGTALSGGHSKYSSTGGVSSA